jgi:hypothetical protein
MRRQSDEDRIIGYFMDRAAGDIAAMQATINSIVRRRFSGEAPKRGRPAGARNKEKTAVAQMPATG